MPILGVRHTKREFLPSTAELPDDEKAWVELITNPTANEIAVVHNGDNPIEQGAAGIVAMIASWNFTDEQGQALPVNLENVLKLQLADFRHLSTKVAESINASRKVGLSDEEKKTSSAGSTVIPVNVQNSPSPTII